MSGQGIAQYMVKHMICRFYGAGAKNYGSFFILISMRLTARLWLSLL